MKNRGTSYLLVAVAVLGLSLLLIGLYQLNAIEKRLVAQAQAIVSLGESTERLSGQLEKIAAEGVSTKSAALDPQAKLLHPEVENFLGPDDIKVPPADAKLGGMFKRGWPFGDPKTLNPALANAAEVQEQLSAYIDSSIAARNIYTDPDKWHGDLAWRVEVTDDSKEYTVYLKRGVKWHKPSGVDLTSKKYAWLAGEHSFTAHDLVFTLDMIVSPQVQNGSLKNYYADLESWKALDDHTFVVRWKKKLFQSLEFTLGLAPMPRFIFAFNEDGTEIPKETLGTRFNEHWYNHKGYVGVGPYRLASYEPGSKLVLERNEDFHGSKPAIKQIVYPIYTDQNQTSLKLKAKELTADRLLVSMYRREVLDPRSLPKEKQPKDNPFLNGQIQCDIIDLPAYRYVGWNSRRPLFNDVRVREAMTYALNREAIVRDVFIGMGTIPTGPFLPGSTALDPEIKAEPFDLTKAAELLTQAGWTDSDGDGLRDRLLEGKKTAFEFSLLIYAGRPEFTTLAAIFKEDLLKIGVKLNVEAAEWSLMQKRMHEKDFDAYTGGWGMSWAQDPYQLWHSSQADEPEGSNMTSFRNAEADELMVKLRETFAPEERTKMLRRVHRLIVDSHNYTFLITERRPFCYHKELKGVVYAKVRPNEYSAPWWLDAN